jgi:hypothetical protein
VQIQSTPQIKESISLTKGEAVTQSDYISAPNQLMDDPNDPDLTPASISINREESSLSSANTNTVFEGYTTSASLTSTLVMFHYLYDLSK